MREAKSAALHVGSFIFIFLICAQISNQQEVNVLIVNDGSNAVAAAGINSALKYFETNSAEGVKIGKKYEMSVKHGDDVELTVNNTCDIVDAAIDSGAPPHLILDATTTGLMSETMKSFTRSLALPTFSASYGQDGDLKEWFELPANEKNYLVQMSPPGDILVHVVRDIVRRQNITNAGIIYDDSFVMEHKYKSLLQNMPCRHIITLALEELAGVGNQLKRLKDADIVNFFVVGRIPTVNRILNSAEELKMFGRKYAWYAISKDSEDLNVKAKKAEIVVMRPFTTTDGKGRLQQLSTSYGLTEKPDIDAAFYFDYAVTGIKAAAEMISDGEFDNLQYIKCDAFNEDSPLERENLMLDKKLKSIRHTATMNEMIWNSNGKSWPMVTMKMDMFTIQNNRVAKKKALGTWDAGMPGTLMFNSGMDLSEHQAVTVYRITTVQQPPFIMKRTTADGKVEFYGYCVDLINEIKKIVEFEYDITEAPDGKFGTMDDNMEWNGMIKELIEKRADIALAPLSVMAERENVVDFTVPYYDLVGITILMKKPKAETSLFKFLSVLQPEVWGCILFAYIFTSVLMYVFDRFSPYSYQNNREKYKDDDEKREFNFKESLWFCMTSLTPQGGGEAPKNLSGRLVAATWWLFGFIIIASYTANLAAFLTVSRLDTPIESLDDLSNQYKVQYAPTNGTSTMTYFERMAYIETKFYEIWKDMSLNDSMSDLERAKLAVWDYPVSDKYTKMWQSMREAGLPSTFEAALERVRASQSTSEGFAYLGDATDIRYQALISCDLQIVGEEFSRKPYAIAVQQGSPLKDQFNDAILKLLNQRKLETLKERWWNQNPEKKICDKEDDQSDGISIENIGGVFIVIFVGIALACITLAFEYWWYKYRKGGRITDSAKVLKVQEVVPEKGGFSPEKTNFTTEYKDGGGTNYSIAPVSNPW